MKVEILKIISTFIPRNESRTDGKNDLALYELISEDLFVFIQELIFIL